MSNRLPRFARRLSRRAFVRAAVGVSPASVVPLTPTGDFFRFQHRRAAPPPFDPAAWTLRIGGLVETSLLLTWEEVLALPAVEDVRALECIGNPVGGNLIGCGRWRGVELAPLLARAGIRPEAAHVRFDAADGYSTAVPLERVVGRDVLLAYALNGEALPRELGAPLRVLIPGLYGQKCPKWLSGIALLDRPFLGYWERPPRNWSDAAVVQTHALFTVPKSHDEVRVGEPVVFRGVAFAGERRITAVEISIDGAAWVPADLRPGPSSLAWTAWQAVWTPQLPGGYEVCVRASDESGFVQTRRAGPFSAAYPAGTDAIHAIHLRVV